MPPTSPQSHDGIMFVQREHPATLTTGWGWTFFAALMMLTGSLVTGAWGFVAILSDDYWGGDQAVSGHAALWGWLWVGFAVIQASVAIGVLVRNGFATIVGIAMAVISVISQAVGFDNYPIWSGIVLAIDALILWALIRHGFDT